LAVQIESKGTNTSVAQPTDVETLHTKDVGLISNKGNSFRLEKFVETYRQPPLSRYFATVDLSKLEDGPNAKKSEYRPVRNPAFVRAIDSTDLADKDYIGNRQLNSFDVEVLYAAMSIARMMVFQRLEMALANYSEIENRFSMAWEGERNNVF
jgi:hypothetical protein